jgi:hypothetical protein
MKQNLTIACIAAFIITISLIVELSQFFYVDKVYVQLLISFYYALLNQNSSSTIIACCLIAQMLQSFCCYSFFYLPLVYVIPLTIASMCAKRFFYPSFFYGPCIAALAGVITVFIIENALLKLNPTTNYTMIKIGAILISNICFSLIIKNWGVLDNRSIM